MSLGKDLNVLAQEIKRLESDVFEITDYTDTNDMFDINQSCLTSCSSSCSCLDPCASCSH